MRKAAVLALALASGSVMAEAPYWYQCTHQGSERQIVVSYPAQPAPVPCEVRYNKLEKGQADSSAVVWSAQYQTGYCESKADSFVQKQQNWGWQCQRIEGVPAAK
ncbi:hypothetical protein [Spongorhabdus nitratireducens]